MTPIKKKLLAEIKAKASAGEFDLRTPSEMLSLISALEDAQRERDAAVQYGVRELMPERDALRAENEKLRAALEKVVHDIDDLIGNSHGVSGLHLNGDEAPWSELTDGGRYEAWLSLYHARDALSAAANKAVGHSGLVLVPKEPTDAMKRAGNEALAPWVAPAMHSEDAYFAMVSAAQEETTHAD